MSDASIAEEAGRALAYHPLTASGSKSSIAPGRRWDFLDAMRGFALVGILFVNVPDLLQFGYEAHGSRTGWVQTAYDFAIQTRFVPIFTFLFGVSTALILQSLREQVRRPRVVLARRFALLLVIGSVHSLLFYPGEVLHEYAVAALVILLPATFLPRWAVLTIGIVGTASLYAYKGGGIGVMPFLFLAGYGATMFGLPAELEHAGRKVATVFAITSVLACGAVLLQTTTPGDPRFTQSGEILPNPGGIAGGILAVVYVTGLALAWRTRVRGMLAAVFAPFGKMALTNYIAASAIIATVKVFGDFTTVTNTNILPLITIPILIAQWIGSMLWLRHFQYGPLEWIWRTGTHWKRIPIRR